MRILHVDKLPSAPGGVRGYVTALAALLRGRGHAVGVFGCAPPGQTDANRPAYTDFTATRNPAALLKMIHNADAAAKLGQLLRREAYDVAHLVVQLHDAEGRVIKTEDIKVEFEIEGDAG